MRIIQGLLIGLIILVVAVTVFSILRTPDVAYVTPLSRTLESSQIENAMYNLKCCGYEQITALGTAKGLNATYLSHSSCGSAQAVRISFEDDARVRFDGNDASLTAGEIIQDNDIYNGPLWIYWSDNLSNFSFINYTSNVTAVANIHYFYVR